MLEPRSTERTGEVPLQSTAISGSRKRRERRDHALGVFEAIGTDAHEEVLFGVDRGSGLQAIIAVHSTALGPALGGTRFYPYGSETEALRDVLRLSKAMTYKSAVAGLDLGGGKAVIIGDPRTAKSERLFRMYGRMIESLGGTYITAEDVGTTSEDMVAIARETRWVSGLPNSHGGSGDPSPATARGVIAAMRSIAAFVWGNRDLTGKRIAVQGVGKVGADLVRRLSEAGAETIVADVNEAALDEVLREHGSKSVDTEDVYDVDCDIFAPCALGGGLSESTIRRLRCAAVAGSANNQLDVAEDADRLAARGIVYAPDFVVNAGGIINIASGREGHSAEKAAEMIDRIADNVTDVLQTSRADGVNPHVAATRVAERRLDGIGGWGRKRRTGEAATGGRQ